MHWKFQFGTQYLKPPSSSIQVDWFDMAMLRKTGTSSLDSLPTTRIGRFTGVTSVELDQLAQNPTIVVEIEIQRHSISEPERDPKKNQSSNFRFQSLNFNAESLPHFPAPMNRAKVHRLRRWMVENRKLEWWKEGLPNEFLLILLLKQNESNMNHCSGSERLSEELPTEHLGRASQRTSC